jgi:hypothetical protein
MFNIHNSSAMFAEKPYTPAGFEPGSYVLQTRDRCYDFLNISAKKIQRKNWRF